MCGICGIVDHNNIVSEKLIYVKKITNKLTHRGPDNEGFFEDKIVSFGFKRLSILDVNKGNQPIYSPDKSIVSIFNGEIYNFKEIKKELEDSGYKFISNSDSEIIPYAYEKWGIEFVKKLNGMFAIAIYDKKKQNTFLIRDRLGIKPLYYYIYKNTLIFSSEINSILEGPFFKREPNLKAISSYLSYRYPISDEETFFLNLKRLPAGKILKISNNGISFDEYWRIPFPNNFSNHDEEFYLEKLDYLLNESIKGQLVSDVPLGVFLSGGLDSSILTAIATKYTKEKLNTFSVTLKESGYDESEKAKIVSNHLKTNHHEIILEKDNFIENLQNLISIKGVPGSIPHEYALFLLSKKMKEKITVVLSGEGADEFFGGYARVQKSPFDFHKNQFINKLKYLNNKKLDFKTFLNKRYNWFSIEKKNKLFNQEFKNKIDHDQELDENWSSYFKEGNLETNYGNALYMFQSIHLKCLLDRLDSMTMAASIEARVPFLDHRIVEFINTVPFKFKIKWKSFFHKILSLKSNSKIYSEKNDINKYLLRKIGEKYLPRQISASKKLGFPVPLDDWLKNENVKDILLDKDSKSKDFYNIKELEETLKMNGKSEYDFSGKRVWMLLNIELWMKKNFGN